MASHRSLSAPTRPTPWSGKSTGAGDRIGQTDELVRLAGGDDRVALACAILLLRRSR